MGNIIGAILMIGTLFTAIAGWVNNIIWLISGAQAESAIQVIVAIIGILLVPVGVIHGLVVW